MITAPFRVVLDANVLYPFTLRDTLLRAAEDGRYQLYWSHQILNEAIGNLVVSTAMTSEQGARLRAHMERAFPEAMVTGHELLIDVMPNDPKDRHVAAAAVKVGAQVIVTMNLKDFRVLPDGIEAQSPDDFLSNLFDLDADGFIALLRRQAAAKQKPPISFEELVATLGKLAPELAASVSEHLKRA